MSDIVVIEEDKLMRGLLVEWLNAAGYSVRVASPPCESSTINVSPAATPSA